MDIRRQGVLFLAVGCGLIVVDWGVFVGLSALGMPPDWANVLGRVAGALLGFGANSGVTFRRANSTRYGLRRFVRFLVVWCTLTAVSTVLVTDLADHLSLEVAWLAKPVVEAGLAVISFFVYRHWVYV